MMGTSGFAAAGLALLVRAVGHDTGLSRIAEGVSLSSSRSGRQGARDFYSKAGRTCATSGLAT